eukprot:6177347-Pleurochrysis_carterae.AAC.1
MHACVTRVCVAFRLTVKGEEGSSHGGMQHASQWSRPTASQQSRKQIGISHQILETDQSGCSSSKSLVNTEDSALPIGTSDR